MATGTIKSFALPDPDHRTATGGTTTVPSNSYTNVMSLTLPKGTWVIMAHGSFTDSFDGQMIMEIRRGSTRLTNTTVRGTGISGGGLHTGIIETVSSSTTYNLYMWQGSGSDKTADGRLLTAVKIK